MFHHFSHVVHVALRVVLGVLTHGTCLNFMVFLGVVFFAVVLAGSVMTHYIYNQEKNSTKRIIPYLFFP